MLESTVLRSTWSPHVIPIVFFFIGIFSLQSATISLAQNLTPSSTWTAGSGSIGIFQQNGTSSQNIREVGAGPFGDQVMLWKAVPDAANGSDGGWDTDEFPINKSKLYRFSVWIKKTNSTDGTTYFGCEGNMVTSLAGVLDSNPYFWYGDLPEFNKWYLLVGYVHAYDDPSTTNYGAVYDGVTGTKLWALTDFKFTSTATVNRHRAYLYYDTNTSDRQYFYNPEVYEIAGTSPLSESVGPLYTNANAFFGARVGIGTSTPQAQLEIKAPYNGNSQVTINTTSGNGELSFKSNNTLKGFVWYTTTNDLMAFGRGSGSNSLFVTSGGNFGLGTMTPNEKLTVNGKVYAKEVRVDLNVPGPDYVFDDGYPLLPLSEVKKYIDSEKHLPEVPSAMEMQENGISVSEMNMILLKKVEELTLYLINKDIEIQELKLQVQDLRNKTSKR